MPAAWSATTGTQDTPPRAAAPLHTGDLDVVVTVQPLGDDDIVFEWNDRLFSQPMEHPDSQLPQPLRMLFQDLSLTGGEGDEFSLPLLTDWHRWGDSAPAQGWGQAIALDATGEVAVVVGHTDALGGFDFALTVFNITVSGGVGSTLLQLQWGSNQDDYALAVALAAFHPVAYVAGYTHGVLPGNEGAAGAADFALSCVLVDAGAVLWQRQWGSAGFDMAFAVTLVQGESLVVVAGFTDGVLPNNTAAGGSDFAVCGLSAWDGEVQWQVQWGTNGSDAVHAVARGADDETIVVAGTTTGTLPDNAAQGEADFVLASLNVSMGGTLLWQQQWGSPGTDVGSAVTLLNNGSLALVAGSTNGELPGNAAAGGSDFALSCVNISDGQLLWQRQWGSTDDDVATAVAPIRSQSLALVTGHTAGRLPNSTSAGGTDFALSCLSVASGEGSEGDILWLRQWGSEGDDDALALAVSNDALALVAGSVEVLPGSNGTWDGNGTELEDGAGFDNDTGHDGGGAEASGREFSLSTLLLLCPIGSMRGWGEFACQLCPGGTFSDMLDTYMCSTCSAGTASGGAGASNCSICPLGYFSDFGAAECTPCQPGWYGTIEGAPHEMYCSPCEPGMFAAEPGAAACDLCPAGTYADDYAHPTCTACPEGTASLDLGATTAQVCDECSAGTYAADPGAATCTPCPAGHFAASNGASLCDACPPGYASPVVGATSSQTCVLCGIGAAAPQGSANCTVCPAGTFAAGAANSDCAQCPAGTYSAALRATHSTTCYPCPPGTSSSVTGAASADVCSTCPPGTYAEGNLEDGIECRPCAAGTYSSAVGATDAATCTSCPAGAWSDEVGAASAAVCRSCPAGTWSSALGAQHSSACAPCAAGTYSNVQGASAASTCVQCLPGTWSSDVAANSPDTCRPCPAGTWSSVRNATSLATCQACAPGTWSDVEGASRLGQCRACAAGSWSDTVGATDADACQPCPAGTWSSQPSAAALEACTPCGAGHYSSMSGASTRASCQACPAGTWSASETAASAETCVQCPAGTYSSTAGATSSATCIPCPAGSHSSIEGAGAASTCQLCPAGTWSAEPGATLHTTCQQCGAGHYQPAQGANSATACVPCATGRYGPSAGATAATACIPCAAGSFAAQPASAACTLCPGGSFGTAGGKASQSEACTPCSAGSYGNGTGLTACVACTAGKYRAEPGAWLAEQCLACPAGTYGPSTGLAECTECPPGTSSNSTGATLSTVCQTCPAGSYGVGDSTTGVVCRACDAGTYSVVQGATDSSTCTRCPAGTWSDRAGASNPDQCTSCPAGTWSSELGAKSMDSCVQCQPGTWNDVEGASRESQCRACAAGSWSARAGASSSDECALCPAGTWSSVAGAVSESQCVPCRAGTFSTVQGSGSEGSCQQCPPGTWSDEAGMQAQSGCRSCPRGTWSGALGASAQSSCQPCDAGTYNPLEGSATALACLACPAGTWSSITMAEAVDQCLACLAGTYGSRQRATNASSCLPCPAGTYSDVAGAAGIDSCQFCPAGTYSMEVQARDRGACRTCPVGATCPGSTPPYAEPGSWYSLDDPTVFVRCTPPAACLGGDLRQSGNGTRSVAAPLCDVGYTSQRCSECVDGHYRYGGLCRSCPTNRLMFTVLCALALVAVLLATHAVLKLGINLAPLTIAVDYFQVLSNFGRFDVHWPEGPQSMMTMFSLVDLNVEAAAPECFVGVSFTRDWAVVAVLPFVCATLLIVHHALWRVTVGRRGKAGSVQRHRDSRVGEMLLLLQVMYLTLATKALQLFDCQQLADGSLMLTAAPYIRCWSAGSEHSALVVMGVAAVLLYVIGVPALFWHVLGWARRQEQTWEAVAPAALRALAGGSTPTSGRVMSQEQMTAWRGARRAMIIAGNLSQRFRPDKGHWLLVVMARKVALVWAFVFFASRPQTQMALVAVVMLAALELHHKHQPYVDRATQLRRQQQRRQQQRDDEDVGSTPGVEMCDNPMRATSLERQVRAVARVRRLSSLARSQPARMSPARRLGHNAAAAAPLSLAGEEMQRTAGDSRSGSIGRIVARVRRTIHMLATAAEDANVMEWVALMSALLVLLSAQVYHAARLEMVTGNERNTLNVRLFVTDVCCVAILATTCAYMGTMALSPMLRPAWAALRRRQRHGASENPSA